MIEKSTVMSKGGGETRANKTHTHTLHTHTHTHTHTPRYQN